GSYCTRCLTPTGTGKDAPGPLGTATAPPTGMLGGSFQHCESCGRDEYRGTFCSYCRTGTYWLVFHDHGAGGRQGSCSLGPYLDPTNQDPSARRSFAESRKAWEASDPPVPATVRWLHL